MGNIKINQKNVSIGRDQVVAAGDINFGAIQNRDEFNQQMENLIHDFAVFAQKSGLDEEKYINIESRLRLAMAEAKKEKPSQQNLLDRLNSAKSLLEGIASAGGMVTALISAAESVRKFF